MFKLMEQKCTVSFLDVGRNYQFWGSHSLATLPLIRGTSALMLLLMLVPLLMGLVMHWLLVLLQQLLDVWLLLQRSAAVADAVNAIPDGFD
ncbi:hypothetical protein Acr_22g0005140 [Actinidia rufa]|uniref:Uncharacterized protein n=1 Tax=Actinidia rufa TaxID=165716 RepID=A0A7J0GJY2_9ERIC|nr:hypothetical protein Acr_22g0005140 [Actinidia rufa]